MTRATSVFVSEPGDRDVLEVRDHDVPDPARARCRSRSPPPASTSSTSTSARASTPCPRPSSSARRARAPSTRRRCRASPTSPSVTGWRGASRRQRVDAGQQARADSVVPVPDGVDLEVAAAAMLQGLTAHYLVTSTYAVGAGDVALVHAAAGGVGQLLVQMITARGGDVVATAGTDEKLDIARALGAQHLINYSTRRRPRRRRARGRRSRRRRGLRRCRQVDVRRLARLAAAARHDGPLRRGERPGAALRHPAPQQPAGRSSSPARRWRTTSPSATSSSGAPARCSARSPTGRSKIDIGGRYPLTEAAAAYEALEGRRTTGKLILVPGA